MNKKDRNVKISHMYREGATQAEIATRYKLTTARIGQILREEGVLQSIEPIKYPAFTGVHMETELKQTMRDVAAKEGKSMSRFMADLAENEIKRRTQ